MDPINQMGGGRSSNKGPYIVIGVLVLIIFGYLMRDKLGFTKSMNIGGYNVDVTKNLDGSTTVKSGNGLANGTYTTNKLLDNWPSDAPVYPNATITQSTFVDSQVVGTESSFLSSLTTSDSDQMVADFYKNKLASLGWVSMYGDNKAVSDALKSATGGAMTNLTFKKDNRMLTVIISSLKTGGATITESTGIIPASLQKSLDTLKSIPTSQNSAKAPSATTTIPTFPR
jgi:hypothetical protein